MRRPFRKFSSIVLIALLIFAAYRFGALTSVQNPDVKRLDVYSQGEGRALPAHTDWLKQTAAVQPQSAARAAVGATATARPEPTSAPALEPKSAPAAKPSSAPTAEPTPAPLSRGAKGAEVEALQERLNAVGYSAGSVDGKYGKNTQSAVRAFQNAAGLPRTGEVDDTTRRLLFSSRALLYAPRITEAPEWEAPSEPMVWIPRTGVRYHSSARCSNMKEPAHVALSEARRRGFTPCKKCYS